jgi:hypothetical protein
MYTTVRGVPATATEPTDGAPGVAPDVEAEASDDAPEASDDAPAAGRRRPAVPRVVLLLGTVSLFTDLSSEMVSAVLPVYLTLVLGLTPLQYGIVDGIYTGVTAAVRIGGGLGADLTRRPKAVAVLGYGLSCVCKLFFLPAHSFAAVGAVVAVDRSGKGIRTAPRDAMIVAASPRASLGHAFGVHRAMDTLGALGGPLLAFGILAGLTTAAAYDAIFVLSFSLAAVGLAVLVHFVPGRQSGGAGEPRAGEARAGEAGNGEAGERGGRRGLRRAARDVAGLVRLPGYRRTMAAAALLSLATVSDGFVYLVLRERADVGPVVFPLLFVGTSLAYLLLAIPLGRLADRVGRTRVFLAGHAVAALGYLGLFLLPPGPALVVAVLALVGTYYAATDGVLPALTAPQVPASVLGSGIAGVQTVMALGALGSAVLFGGLWARFGSDAAVLTFAVGLLAAVAVGARLLRGVERSAGEVGA